MNVRLSIYAATALLVLGGCTSERDLGNVPDGGGDAGGGVAFAGAYAGVLTQGNTSCRDGQLISGSSSNAVLTLSMPTPTEVDVVSVTVCPVHGTPAGNIVHIQPIVCPTVTGPGGSSSTTMYTDMSSLTLTNATTLEVHLYTSSTSVPAAGQPLYDCVSQLSGTLIKQ